jgi:hypothetical protein
MEMNINSFRLFRLRAIRFIRLLILVLSSAGMLIIYSFTGNYVFPRIDELLWAARLGESTVYAKGYTLRRLRSIRIGMTGAEVEVIMGPPLRQGPWGGLPVVWFYSDQKTVEDNFWRRWVVFDNGRVVEVINDFWID